VNFLLENWMLVFIAVSSGVALMLPNLQNLGAAGITPTQAVLMINREKANIVDVRSAEEFATGHLIGARHVPVERLQDDLSKTITDKKRPLILVCASGMRSGRALGVAKAQGFEQAHSLGGGLKIWQEANLPLEKA
jgi:rhodanese-related sulfurtransferase